MFQLQHWYNVIKILAYSDKTRFNLFSCQACETKITRGKSDFGNQNKFQIKFQILYTAQE